MAKTVLIIAKVHEYLTEKLRQAGYETLFFADDELDRIPQWLPSCSGIVTSNKLKITKELIDQAPRLEWIGRMGSGMEIIDVAYARQRNIKCYSSPEGNANAVAEQALGMLLHLQRHIGTAYQELKAGRWLREENRGDEIEGRTAGIIGLGNNGLAFARKLSALSVRVLGYDKYKDSAEIPSEITACPDLKRILQEADILSFHVPLTDETHHYFNDDFLRQMQHKFVLLNLSRGPVVSFETLYKGITTGKITAAALDVWEQEPFWESDPSHQQQYQQLFSLPNFIGTPHIGGYTHQATYKMSVALARKIGL